MKYNEDIFEDNTFNITPKFSYQVFITITLALKQEEFLSYNDCKRKTNKTDQNDQDYKIEGTRKIIAKRKRLYVRDSIQNNLKYNIQNIQGKYNRMVHSNNNSNIKPSVKWRYSHKLRWYNITLQEKGFHHINDNIYKPYYMRCFRYI
ncbi:hypothetical protein H8356DRAFT_1329872 [Neocallimastix lanati (nom. inval.)]|nr:hypothetical protein H8356DRAFT_1329872 [Neocallimastix sp. JGI-2020a]